MLRTTAVAALAALTFLPVAAEAARPDPSACTIVPEPPATRTLAGAAKAAAAMPAGIGDDSSATGASMVAAPESLQPRTS